MTMNNTAIIVVDVQNDFVEGGALAVQGGRAIIRNINKLFVWLGVEVPAVFSQDSHPLKTAHFDKWPVHCVAGSKGAELVDGLPKREGDLIVLKGQGTEDDGYSAFDKTDLYDMLRSAGITSLYICGIATDYCVKATVMDALQLGFHVTVVLDACAAVNGATGAAAVQAMKEAGASTMLIESVAA